MDRGTARSSTWSTRELVDLCCDMDAGAWDEFVRRYNRQISTYSVRASTFADAPESDRRDEMKEFVQDVYLRLIADNCHALRAWHGETDESLRAYLRQVATRLACDRRRREQAKKRKVALVSIDATPPDGEQSIAERIPASASYLPDRMLAERLVPERLEELLGELGSGPNALRNALIFKLHVIDGMTAKEIASIPELDMQVPTVESVIRRTRERLKKTVGDPSRLTD